MSDTTGGTDSPSDRTSQVADADAVASAPTDSASAQEVVVTRNVVVTNEVSTRTLWKIVGVVVIVLVGFIVMAADRGRIVETDCHLPSAFCQLLSILKTQTCCSPALNSAVFSVQKMPVCLGSMLPPD